MIRHISREMIIVVLLMMLALLVPLGVLSARYANTPPGHEFIPIHNSLSDYPFYVSVIAQGIDGEVSVRDQFAVEAHEGSVIHFLYLLIGWVARLVGIQDAQIAYHVSRFVLGVLWVASVYSLVKRISKAPWIRILSMFFILFSASVPLFHFTAEGIRISWFMTWWSELDPTIRNAFVPHFLVGHIMMVGAIVSCISYLQLHGNQEASGGRASRTHRMSPIVTWWQRDSEQGKRFLVRGFVAAWIAGFVHPPSAILLLMVMPLLFLFYRTKRIGYVTLAICSGAFISLWIITRVSSVSPWNLPKQFEAWSFAISMSEYLLALGPVVLFALVGLYAIFGAHRTPMFKMMRETHYIPFVIFSLWIITSIGMIPVSMWFVNSPIPFFRSYPISNIRFLQMAVWVPFGILASYGSMYIWKRSGRFIGVGALLSVLFLTFVGYVGSLREQVSHVFFSHEYMYPEAGYLTAIRDMAKITKPGDAILSLSLAGMTIPMYTNRTTYVGQVVYTPAVDFKLGYSWKFFKGEISACDAYTFMKQTGIRVVFYSFDEQHAGDAVKFYAFLQPWNSYGTTSIYRFVDVPPAGCQYTKSGI